MAVDHEKRESIKGYAAVMDLAERQKMLPSSPGVYLFKDAGGTILYIGKAARIRSRVQQYFSQRGHTPKIEAMVRRIAAIDYIETPSEADALILEASLINQHLPKYNTRLRDDKSYPLLLLTNEPYARLLITRMHTARAAKKAAGTFFGPYTDAALLREAVRIIHESYPIRKCRVLPQRACVYYYIKQCIAPCIHRDAATKEQYDALIGEIASFLKSGKRSLIAFLTARMKAEAAALRFEQAAVIKKRIEALEKLHKKRFSRQKGVSVFGTATKELAHALGIRKRLYRIVCFDVSNLMGKWAVASKVSFYKELPDKNDYRRYKIRTVSGIDDYRMMQEVVTRMLDDVCNGTDTKPDLIMIDGGKGHLRAAQDVIRQGKCPNIPAIALAKRFEMLFNENIEPLILPAESPALYLVKKIRDEAHRFAIEYHRKIRGKEIKKSLLDTVPGIGERKKALLLKRFGSISGLRAASAETIAEVPSISPSLAREIKRHISSDTVKEKRV